MADVERERVTALWREAAAGLDEISARARAEQPCAECGRLREQLAESEAANESYSVEAKMAREQLDAVRQALAEELEQKAEAVIQASALRRQLAALLQACTFVSSVPGDDGSPAKPSIEAWVGARAALGVEGEQEKPT